MSVCPKVWQRRERKGGGKREKERSSGGAGKSGRGREAGMGQLSSNLASQILPRERDRPAWADGPSGFIKVAWAQAGESQLTAWDPNKGSRYAEQCLRQRVF